MATQRSQHNFKRKIAVVKPTTVSQPRNTRFGKAGHLEEIRRLRRSGRTIPRLPVGEVQDGADRPQRDRHIFRQHKSRDVLRLQGIVPEADR